MDDFSKTKIAFAAGLLALLFTAYPVLGDSLNASWSFFGVAVTLRSAFWLMSGLLTASVYATAIRLLTQTSWRRAELVANATYALALMVPPCAAVLAAISWLALRAQNVAVPESIVSIFGTAASAVVSALVAWQAYRTSRILEAKVRESRQLQYEREETGFFSRAEALVKQGHYDLAVIDAYRSLEVAARKALSAAGQLKFGPRVESPVRALFRSHLLPEEFRPDVEFVQNRRNLAAHSIEPTSIDEARRVLDSVSRILARLTDAPGASAA